MILYNSVLSFSQEIKKYSGEFYDGNSPSGNANYSYYLVNDERIKEGLFTYSDNVKSVEGSFSITITGNYKNNFKEGKWIQNIKFNDWNNGIGNYVTGSISLINSYNEGLPNGQWTYTENSKSRIKINSSNGNNWSTFTAPTSSKVLMNFKNGVLIDNFLLSNLSTGNWNNINTTFNESGYCFNNLIMSMYSDEIDIEFYKDIMTKYINRDKSTGEIKDKTSFLPEEISQIKKFADNKINTEELINNHLKPDTIRWLKLEDLKTSVYKSLFLNEYIKGDKVYDSGFDFGGYYIIITKFNQMKLSEIDKIERAESILKNTSENEDIFYLKIAIENLETAKEQYKNNISISDMKILNERIEYCNQLIAKQNDVKKMLETRKSDWMQISFFRSQGSSLEEVEAILIKVKIFRDIYKSYLTVNNKDLIDYKGISSLYNDAENDKDLVDKKILDLEKSLKIKYSNREIEKQNDKTIAEKNDNEIILKKYEINNENIFGYNGQYGRGGKIKEVDDLYIDDNTGNVYSSNKKSIKKKNLYNAYEISKNYLVDKRNNFTNNKEEAIQIGNKIIKLCDKIIDFLNQDTEELEKKVKSEKDPEKILEIFGI